jgi:hypothetical protein
MPSSSSSQEFLVFHGTIIHSLSLRDLEINENAVIVVNVFSGKIVLLERNVDKLNEFLSGLALLLNKQYSVSTVGQWVGILLITYEIIFLLKQVNVLKKDQFILPGFIDTHAVSLLVDLLFQPI